MKKIVLKYGTIASIIVVGIPAVSMVFTGSGRDSFDMGEVIGYSSMIVAMGLVYFAMRYFRDKENEGELTFGQGMKIGVLISAMGGAAWGLYNYIFVTFIMPDFNEQYYAHQTGQEIGSPEFEQGFAQMMEANGFMFSKAGGTLLMFVTVFLIGFIISVISSLILQRKSVAAA